MGHMTLPGGARQSKGPCVSLPLISILLDALQDLRVCVRGYTREMGMYMTF